MFNAYLEEAKKQSISTRINITATTTTTTSTPPIYKPIPVRDNVTLIPEIEEVPLQKISCDMDRLKLLRILQNEKNCDAVKMDYLREYKYVFDEDTNRLTNGGLMRDWDFVME
jgi:hypothetical protein